MTRADQGQVGTAKVFTALQVVALYVLPLLLIVTDAVPAAYRYWLFGIGMTIPLLEMIFGRWSPRRIRLRTDTLAPYLLPYIVFTTVLTTGLLLLAQWFLAMWLVATAKNGISSVELGRRLGIEQTNAWALKQKLMHVFCDRYC